MSNHTANIVETIGESVTNLPQDILNNLGLIIDLGKYILVLGIIYLVFIIVRQFFRFKDSFRLKAIAKNTTEISKKLDKLIKIHSGEDKSKKKKKKN